MAENGGAGEKPMVMDRKAVSKKRNGPTYVLSFFFVFGILYNYLIKSVMWYFLLQLM